MAQIMKKHYCHYVDDNKACNKFDESFNNYCDEHKLLNRNFDEDYNTHKKLVYDNIIIILKDISDTVGRSNKIHKANLLFKLLSETKWFVATYASFNNVVLERLLEFTSDYNEDCLIGNEHLWIEFDLEYYKHDLFPDIYGQHIIKDNNDIKDIKEQENIKTNNDYNIIDQNDMIHVII